MKSASFQLQNMLKQGETIPLKHKLTAEWNYNRYVTISSIDNNPALTQPPSSWDVLFPISSIVQPDRPGAGIVRGWTDTSTVAAEPINVPTGPRSYSVSDEDVYRYWISPGPSQSTWTSALNGYAFDTAVCPTVIYASAINVNKIVVGIENSVVSPTDYAIEVSPDGTTWTQIAHNPTIDAKGRITLYLQPDNSWNATVTTGKYYSMKGIRLKINAVNTKSAYAAVIEISPRREDDLSSYMIDWSTQYTQSNASFLSPLGQISSNTGTLTLFNDGNIFDNDNPNSPYAGMVDKNVRFVLQTGMDTTTFGGAGSEWVTEFTMWSNDFSGSKSPQVSVALVDSSAKLQFVYPPEMLIMGHTAGQIIWRLMDVMGYDNYVYNTSANDDASLIPYYWTSGDNSSNSVAVRKNRLRYVPTKNTLWEEMNRIAEGTQLAIYFDCYDVMQIKTRQYEFDNTKSTNWTLRGQAGSGELASIIDWQHKNTYESNHVDIQYSPVSISDWNNGFPIMETVWTPATDTTLRAATLTAPMTASQMYFYLPPDEASYWPFTSLVNIDGELIQYNGKEYSYRDAKTGKTVTEVIYTTDRQNAIDTTVSDQNWSWTNQYTGKIIVTQRGVDNTSAFAHYNTPMSGYAFPYTTDGHAGSKGNYAACFSRRSQSQVSITTNSSFYYDGNVYMVATNGPSITGTARYGARVRFRSGVGPDTAGRVGVYFAGDTNCHGYHATIMPTAAVGDGSKITETTIWQHYTNPDNKMAVLNKGARMSIAKDIWYDIEAAMLVNTDGSHTLSLMVDGQIAASATVTGSARALGGNFGLVVGEYCSVDVEYLYATTDDRPTTSESNFMNMVTGDYISGYADRTVVNDPNRKRRWTNNKWEPGGYQTYFDDFGSYVHEVRDFSVDFSKNPVLSSDLYVSNSLQLDVLSYTASPFGADFRIANAGRVNAIISGQDSLTFANSSVDQKAFVFGRLISPASSPTLITVSDDTAIRARGPINTTFNSMWLQTNEAAQALGNWIVGHWSKRQKEITVTCFGARLIQVGDIITIDWPARGMTANTNKWYVTGVASAYSSGGIQDTLTIRDANI